MTRAAPATDEVAGAASRIGYELYRPCGGFGYATLAQPVWDIVCLIPVAARTADVAPPAAPRATAPLKAGAASIVDYSDPTYGGQVRQLRKDDGHEHNSYHYRDPWNADGSRMLGIQSDLQQQNWRICFNSNRSRTIDLCLLFVDTTGN